MKHIRRRARRDSHLLDLKQVTGGAGEMDFTHGYILGGGLAVAEWTVRKAWDALSAPWRER